MDPVWVAILSGISGLLIALVGGLFGTLLANKVAREENAKALAHQRLMTRVELYGKWFHAYHNAVYARITYLAAAASETPDTHDLYMKAQETSSALTAAYWHLRLVESDEKKLEGPSLAHRIFVDPPETPTDDSWDALVDEYTTKLNDVGKKLEALEPMIRKEQGLTSGIELSKEVQKQLLEKVKDISENPALGQRQK